ncbi:MAG: Lrp/AsnC family transcriptional regulator [Rhizobacter sp.]|nr:Lrp/AsnC family transcriptional regulator [Rhizobacter sp.]
MSEDFSLDAASLKILVELQRDARQTVQEISEKVGLSATPCWKRIKQMEAAGVIRGYTALIDREKANLHVAAVTEVNLDRHGRTQVHEFEAMVQACPQIVRCVAATGPADYILTVLVPDMKHYEQFLHDTLFKMPAVTHVRSSMVLREVKSETAVPIDHLLPAAGDTKARR